ncbi:MAG: CerR family C-terminal domain-containing protein [Deltaproteobacteria bacterium]|jgi:AcrR family transcriptional regulator|nr:CerR family C-terminal domain-containing protein [Deltaproteobacteria bacterium]
MAKGPKPGKAEKPSEVRAALLKAGSELFGELGLEGASTRALALKARANLSSIRYHFGGKEGLYKAVLSMAADCFGELIGPVRDKVKASLSALEGASLEEARPEVVRLLMSMIAVLVSAIENKKIGKNLQRLILREQTSPTAWFGLLYDGFMADTISVFRALVERYVGQSFSETEMVIRTHIVFAQIVAFLIPREALTRSLGVFSLTDEHRALITMVVGQNVEAGLKAWAAEIQAGPKAAFKAPRKPKEGGPKAAAGAPEAVKPFKAAKGGEKAKAAEKAKARKTAAKPLGSKRRRPS